MISRYYFYMLCLRCRLTLCKAMVSEIKTDFAYEAEHITLFLKILSPKSLISGFIGTTDLFCVQILQIKNTIYCAFTEI